MIPVLISKSFPYTTVQIYDLEDRVKVSSLELKTLRRRTGQGYARIKAMREAFDIFNAGIKHEISEQKDIAARKLIFSSAAATSLITRNESLSDEIRKCQVDANEFKTALLCKDDERSHLNALQVSFANAASRALLGVNSRLSEALSDAKAHIIALNRELNGYKRVLDGALRDLLVERVAHAEHVRTSERGIGELRTKAEECEAQRALVQDTFEKYRVEVVRVANENARRNVLFSAAARVATIALLKQTDGLSKDAKHAQSRAVELSEELANSDKSLCASKDENELLKAKIAAQERIIRVAEEEKALLVAKVEDLEAVERQRSVDAVNERMVLLSEVNRARDDTKLQEESAIRARKERDEALGSLKSVHAEHTRVSGELGAVKLGLARSQDECAGLRKAADEDKASIESLQKQIAAKKEELAVVVSAKDAELDAARNSLDQAILTWQRDKVLVEEEMRKLIGQRMIELELLAESKVLEVLRTEERDVARRELDKVEAGRVAELRKVEGGDETEVLRTHGDDTSSDSEGSVNTDISGGSADSSHETLVGQDEGSEVEVKADIVPQTTGIWSDYGLDGASPESIVVSEDLFVLATPVTVKIGLSARAAFPLCSTTMETVSSNATYGSHDIDAFSTSIMLTDLHRDGLDNVPIARLSPSTPASDDSLPAALPDDVEIKSLFKCDDADEPRVRVGCSWATAGRCGLCTCHVFFSALVVLMVPCRVRHRRRRL
jgi:chromosome segregation ATPase